VQPGVAGEANVADDRGLRSGVIEGFYGRPWSEGQRLALFARMRGWRLGTYLYAPKDDLKHRLLWREPYDAAELAGLSRLVEGAHAQDVAFAYALAPGLDLRFADEEDAAALRGKVGQVLALGVRTVALLFDDVPRDLADADRERFTTLAAAVKAAGLETTLTREGPFTVFAPTDEAFAKLPEGTVDDLLANPEKLKKVLLFHVVSGSVTADQVVELESVETLNGESVKIAVNDGVMINDARVIKTDIGASNGTVHVIDTVLIPPTDG